MPSLNSRWVGCEPIRWFTSHRAANRRRGAKAYGQKCRVDQLLRRFPDRLRKRRSKLPVQERKVEFYDAEVLLRGVHKGRAAKARVIVVIVIVPELKKLKPWYLLTTDLDLDAIAVVEAYAGRAAQVKVNFDEAKELGLGHYQGRSASGVRRWAVLVCLAQALLKLAATGLIKLDLPRLNWSWYKREETVGQIRRRLIEHCRPRISRTLNETSTA